MPVYSFRCPNCKYEFSGIFPMKGSGGENVVCPKCKITGLKRVYKGGASLISKSKSESSSCPTCSSGICGL